MKRNISPLVTVGPSDADVTADLAFQKMIIDTVAQLACDLGYPIANVPSAMLEALIKMSMAIVKTGHEQELMRSLMDAMGTRCKAYHLAATERAKELGISLEESWEQLASGALTFVKDDMGLEGRSRIKEMGHVGPERDEDKWEF